MINSFDKEINFFLLQTKNFLAPKHVKSKDEQSYESLKYVDILHKAALLLKKKTALQIEKKI